MKVSLIVSAYDQPDSLASLLLSLRTQTETDFEVLICDNSTTGQNDLAIMTLSAYWGSEEKRFTWLQTGKSGLRHCYESANWAAVNVATGDYLCFPSCDNQYCPMFLEVLLRWYNSADLIYSDMLYDPRADNTGKRTYTVFNTRPDVGFIDKGGFLVRRTKFQPFPWEENLMLADGLMLERLSKSGIVIQKAPGVLWIHN